MSAVKVLCDTDTLLNNIQHASADRERKALEDLLAMHALGDIELFRSEVNRVEVANTKNADQRARLEADFLALHPVVKEEGLMGAQYTPNPRTWSFSSNPTSDLDSAGYRDCQGKGIKHRDTLHILRAVENACAVFLTRDKGILTRRDWLEVRFPGLKVLTPSGLLELLSGSA